MPLSDEQEAAEFALKMELMRMDVALKTKQAFWETPRNIAILVATVAAVAGSLGFKLGQSQQQAQQSPIIIQVPAPPSGPAR